MTHKKAVLFGATATVALLAIQSGPASAAGQSAPASAASPAASAPAAASGQTTADPAEVADIIVTANKRQENIQNVGMSIQAASGDKLVKLGVTDTASLSKIVPGFTFTTTYTGTQVFTIRGVGFQDTSLGGSPTVSAYLDEAPLPFSALTRGATLDLQRVEVLKGPQGTLFGENATGGAINYVANKPTNTFQAGADLSYGRFNDTDISGFVSGPLTSTLDARIAVRHEESGAWQRSYGPQQGQSIGGKNFTNGRLSLLWQPNDRLKALLTLSGWKDRDYNQQGQLYGIAPRSAAPLPALIAAFPFAPHNNQAADFNSCVNQSPFDPIQGGRDAAYTGGQPTDCVAPRNNNTFYSGALRLDYELGEDTTLTSLTQYQHFKRHSAVDQSGVNLQNSQAIETGNINSVFQELRLAGKFNGKGTWLFGANYEHDKTFDQSLASFAASTASEVFGIPFLSVRPTNLQKTNTYAVYANAEYPVVESITLQGGVRFTQTNKSYAGCNNDGGDGSGALIGQQIANFLEFVNGFTPGNGVNVGPGGCTSTGVAPTFNPPTGGAPYKSRLNENNVSWRAGVNWKVTPHNLIYANVSQGWKAGSYPTVVAASSAELAPVVQEGLRAYEVGFKAQPFGRELLINGAGFYYDYKNKQLLGSIADPIFSGLPALVNIPKSHVVGFEVSGVYSPNWFKGLTITPVVSYQNTKIDKSSKNTCVQSSLATPCVAGHFYNFDAFNNYADFTGEHFPDVPLWQLSVDGEYDWEVGDGLNAFVGANYRYVSGTNNNLVNRTPPAGKPYDSLDIPGYGLLDLRAGVSKGDWQFQVWGRNVTDKWHWNSAVYIGDVLLRYTGMPATYGMSLSYRFH